MCACVGGACPQPSTHSAELCGRRLGAAAPPQAGSGATDAPLEKRFLGNRPAVPAMLDRTPADVAHTARSRAVGECATAGHRCCSSIGPASSAASTRAAGGGGPRAPGMLQPQPPEVADRESTGTASGVGAGGGRFRRRPPSRPPPSPPPVAARRPGLNGGADRRRQSIGAARCARARARERRRACRHWSLGRARTRTSSCVGWLVVFTGWGKEAATPHPVCLPYPFRVDGRMPSRSRRQSD